MMGASLPSPSTPTPQRPGTPTRGSDGSLLLQQPEKSSPEIHSEAERPPRSIYLSPYFLTALCLLFLSFVALLEVLKYLSDKNQGFVSSDEGKHYLWTYGPTFVLSVVAAIWGQVEYRVLQATPWLELRREPQPAERNLLMNYISPWSMTALYHSLGAGHFAVTLSILGGVILKILIIVSTGLLDLEPRQLSYDTVLPVTTQFNLSRAKTASPRKLGDPRTSLWVVYQGDSPGTKYPAGTTSQFAVLPPSLTAAPTGTNIRVTTNTTVFNVKEHECNTFSWTFNTPIIQIGTSSRKTNLTLAEIIKSQEELDLLSKYCLVGTIHQIQARNASTPPMLTSKLDTSIFNKTELVDTRCIPFGRNTPLSFDEARIFTNVMVNLPGNVSYIAAALCRPTYQVTRRTVTVSPSANVLSVSNEIIETLERSDLQPSLLTRDILAAGAGDRRTVGPENAWIDMMILTNPQPDWTGFANPEVLSTAFKKAFKSSAALTAGILKTDRTELAQEVPAHVDYIVTRLVVTTVPLRLMEVLLILATLVASALCFLHAGPKYEPAPSLLGNALILANSIRLEKTLSPAAQDQAPRPETLAARLRGTLLYSVLGPTRTRTTRIEVQSSAPGHNSEISETEPSALQWWLPMAAARTYAMVLVTCTIIAIVLLEILYQVSKRNGGLAEVSTTNNTRFIWLFLPTIIAASIGLAYVAMDKATQTLHPYLELSRGRGTGDTLEFEPRSSMALFALAQSLRRSFFGLSAMILTSILGGILAIAASGLYTAVPFSEVGGVAVKPDSWFAFRGIGKSTPSAISGFARQEITIAESLHFNNLSYPAGVWGQYAFALPTLESFRPYYNVSGPPAKLTARVPAVRMQLNCSLHEFHKSFDDGDPVGPSIQVVPPPGCVNGPNGVPIAGAKIHISNPDDRRGYFGYLAPDNWAFHPKPEPFRWNGKEGDDFANITTMKPMCLNNIRHYYLLYGHRTGTVSTNLTVIRCTPYAEALDIDVTFHLPNMTVDDSVSPPVPANTPARPWAVPNNLRDLNNTMELITFTTVQGDASLDSLFYDFTQGIDGIPISEFADPANMNRSIRRIETAMGKLSAEVISLSFREPFTGAVDEGIPLPGSITGSIRVPLPQGRARLVQSSVSTRLLESLLSALVICSCVSWWLVGGARGEVLPVDPGSVAARMALFAGSDLVEKLRTEGKRGIRGEKLRLGWWEKDGGKRYGIDIVQR